MAERGMRVNATAQRAAAWIGRQVSDRQDGKELATHSMKERLEPERPRPERTRLRRNAGGEHGDGNTRGMQRSGGSGSTA